MSEDFVKKSQKSSQNSPEKAVIDAMDFALAKARGYKGATAPNPPVGAAALAADGSVLAIEAHTRAGELHAEASVIATLKELKILSRAHTMVVTLEPCNHTGRTPPCTRAILDSGFKRVFYGAKDPNPKVAGGGAAFLRSQGIEVVELEERALECADLIAPFAKFIQTGLPYVIVKTAHLENGSMIPPQGQKTFTSDESKKQVHKLRRESDAIFTASGTVIADDPEFTVRLVPDFDQKKRFLMIFDRKDLVSDEYLEKAVLRGFQVRIATDLETELRFLGGVGLHQVLVEAGPHFSNTVLQSGFADEHWMFKKQPGSLPDLFEKIILRERN